MATCQIFASQGQITEDTPEGFAFSERGDVTARVAHAAARSMILLSGLLPSGAAVSVSCVCVCVCVLL